MIKLTNHQEKKPCFVEKGNIQGIERSWRVGFLGDKAEAVYFSRVILSSGVVMEVEDLPEEILRKMGINPDVL